MKKSIHDVNEKVRVAAAEVLLAVMNTNSIAVSDICVLFNVVA